MTIQPLHVQSCPQATVESCRHYRPQITNYSGVRSRALRCRAAQREAFRCRVTGAQVTGFSNSEENALGTLDAVPWSLEDELKKVAHGMRCLPLPSCDTYPPECQCVEGHLLLLAVLAAIIAQAAALHSKECALYLHSGSKASWIHLTSS